MLLRREGAENGFKQFLVRRDLMRKVAHPSALSLFVDSPVHPDHAIEDAGSALRNVAWVAEAPAYLAALNRALAANRDVRKIIGKGGAGGTFQCLAGGDCYAVSLKPVTDSLGRSAGYIVSSSPSGA